MIDTVSHYSTFIKFLNGNTRHLYDSRNKITLRRNYLRERTQFTDSGKLIRVPTFSD